jgi:succinate dehydrogenase/fumarate reductase flavoprotein subunit
VWHRFQYKEEGVQETQYDAIVVGSGISGGWAAKERPRRAFVSSCSNAVETSSTSRTT